MAYETLSQSPVLDDFTALSEHQEQTPGTFFGGKPVLHLHSPSAKVRISQADLSSQPDFAALQASDTQTLEDDVELDSIDIWVSSRNLTLFSTSRSKGLQIPYPTISIHAQEGNAVLLELNLSPSDTMDEDLVFLQLRLVPTSVQHNASAGTNGDSSSDPVAALYNAISACQELNPDPRPDGSEDGEDGGFDETAPGATGWITSENMADFMDEDGNFRIPQGVNVIGGEEEVEDGGLENGLGPGAGHRRTAAEADAEEGARDVDDDETKWQRTG